MEPVISAFETFIGIKMDMRVMLLIMTTLVVVSGSFFSFGNKGVSAKDLGSSIFDFSVDSTEGSVSLSTYKGKKAILIVNVASE